MVVAAVVLLLSGWCCKKKGPNGSVGFKIDKNLQANVVQERVRIVNHGPNELRDRVFLNWLIQRYCVLVEVLDKCPSAPPPLWTITYDCECPLPPAPVILSARGQS